MGVNEGRYRSDLLQDMRDMDRTESAFVALFKEHGCRKPLLVTKKDHWVVSGRRRYVASLLAGLKDVPVEFVE